MTEPIQHPEIVEALHARNFASLKEAFRAAEPIDLAAVIEAMEEEDRAVAFRLLPHDKAADVFEYLEPEAQEGLLKALGRDRVASILNEMSPDDRTALLEELPAAATRQLLHLLTPDERRIAVTLLGYPEDSIGRLMTPDYVAVGRGWTVQQCLDHIRKHGSDSETLNVIYVVDEQGRLHDDLRIRQLLMADPGAGIADITDGKFVSLKAWDDQELAVSVFAEYDRVALPVVDSHGAMLGIVTFDDVWDVAEEEATEDIQKLGGMEALDEPYIETSFLDMVKKRAGWLIVLFLGQMLTANAIGWFQDEISQALVLVLFLPLIISSGGNSGSQAATLVIRSMSLGEIGLRDWWRVMRREVLSGLALGAIVGAIGFVRIAIGEIVTAAYGPKWPLLGVTVAVALVVVVLWGTLVGSMLPFVMRRVGADPAASSTPFVSTLVDVTGLVIYFSVASVTLEGHLF